jgi:hypothetical protein
VRMSCFYGTLFASVSAQWLAKVKRTRSAKHPLTAARKSKSKFSLLAQSHRRGFACTSVNGSAQAGMDSIRRFIAAQPKDAQ